MSTIYLSEHANYILIDYLKSLGHHLIFIRSTDLVYDAVSAHPDIYLCKMGADKRASVFIGDKTQLGFEYPQNIGFNAVCMGHYFIHNLKYTSPELMETARNQGMTFIHVKQGYTKCNTVVVDENAIITSDAGIVKALNPFHMEILLIQSGYVNLPGLPYGFLGGASGRVGNQIVFNGNLEQHPDCKRICEFIESRGLSVHYFREYELEDIGSIIETDSNDSFGYY
ncbi:DUF6873 family GME fold protein [Clostridium aminobutyricum]|uniref:DUF6873 domain-containing protein n=1 Tax=Clostridium aminobutyricum TaxID=33953 RepID=A0A939D876_CLOAM|nr:hypothetical protein [Clostridium aminobutyricum]MBN7772926.1 hypothetical protein [Clostridium aminobutyricum]